MDNVQTLETCARAPECLKGGFIHPGEATKIIKGKVYHEECADLQERENQAS